ncbi:hypothetical protein [Flavobacterium granuli]|uniref:Uncharacterized protein n=1 Tax=Flavobacterium granuli TaxID=280093 RepID=A0A1M5RNM8_9FLAO|nr:hypothetical protein [Flavobacterium granuli]PRZ22803.1 hypothetical protein BC624_10651 [Flavobacterium granuli]SHH27957.1 hypothetical protein SAMN05443373_11071 [Flavobacterium granuli]
MKKPTLEELPEAVVALYGKIEALETVLKQNSYSSGYNVKFKNDLTGGKCSSSFNKSDLAQFFYILMDENILFFDRESEQNNRSKMQQFIQDNFTYAGDSGSQVGIHTISKQFSESKGFTYGAKQLKFLNKLIKILKRRKGIVACR